MKTKSVFILTLATSMMIVIHVVPVKAQTARPYTVEYYYKVKWGYLDEFLALYKKNHFPILKELRKRGEILDMKATYPLNHQPESARWDFRFTITFKNFYSSGNKALEDEIARQLYPDQVTFKKEEQRRFEILIEHTDIPLREEDLSTW